MAIADQLTRGLERAGIPVFGVSIGTDADRATWRVQYRPEATAQQRVDGDALVLAFDLVNDVAWTDEQADVAVQAAKVAFALTAALWKQLLGRWPTATERQTLKADAKTAYKSF